MGKIISAILAIFTMCGFMTACNFGDSSVESKSVESHSYTTQGKETKLVSDEALTGELRVSCGGSGIDTSFYLMMKAASEKFQELYPNVNLVFDYNEEGLNSEEYRKKMAAQILAGKGPDVFSINETDLDVTKAMEAGVVADMFSYFENDKNFNIQDYNEVVFSGGQPNGKQFIVPISYKIPLFLTTEKMIEKSGLDISKCNNYLSLFQEFDRVMQNEVINKSINKIWDINSSLIYFPKYSGIDRFDYSEDKVKLDSPEFKSIFEIIKKHRKEYLTDNSSGVSYSSDSFAGNFKDEKSFFADFTMFPFDFLIQTCAVSSFSGEKPIMFALKNVNGKLTASQDKSVAVRNNSENKQNACNFIKILINAETTGNTGWIMSGIPVSIATTITNIERIIQNEKDDYDGEAVSFDVKEFTDKYTAFLDEIEDMELSFTADLLLKEEMQPYYYDEKSYEECIESAKNKLEIYLSE